MRAGLLLFLTAVLISFTGCSNECEIRDRAFVQSIGMEHTDGRYKVSLRIFGDDNCYIGSGETFNKAVADAEQSQGKKFYTGHTELIVIREEESEFLLENLVNEDISLDCLVLYDISPAAFVKENDTESLTDIISDSEKNICEILNQN